MRLIIIFSLLLMNVARAKAQNSLQRNYFDQSLNSLPADSSHFNYNNAGKKWFVSRYAGIATSFGFFNGANATVFAAPVGLQLNRRLTNNWYAFAGISATPAYIGFNHSFLSANTNKLIQAGNFQSNNFNLYPKAEMGLMYINDQKTFSISGSISVERSNYFFAPVNQFGNGRTNNFKAAGK